MAFTIPKEGEPLSEMQVDWLVGLATHKGGLAILPPELQGVVPQIGDRTTERTVYAGISPDTGLPMYTTPAAAPERMTFDQACRYAGNLHDHGHEDWRLPSKSELNFLFENRVAIGGFTLTGSGPRGGYWSGTEESDWSAWNQAFTDGYQYNLFRGALSSVRCVRSGARRRA